MTAAPALTTISPCLDQPSVERHPRWKLWRSPPGQPAWARPALLAIAAVAALLYAWNIARVGYAPVYSDAVKAMSESWKAFFYGAANHADTITLDKLAGSFLPQALAARIFGYHAWALELPQVIEGVISVLVMYRAMRRWAGVIPGLLAAGILATTPIVASMFGHGMEDGALTMCLVIAADSFQRAIMEARLRSLIWAGVWVGLGFQAKMMQAWMVLPAFGLTYLIAAPARPRRRIWHLCVAGIVMLAVSVLWVALYTLTPAKDRPYVEGTTNNSAITMVFGYNGLGRFGINIPGARSFNGTATISAPPPSSGASAPQPSAGTAPANRHATGNGSRPTIEGAGAGGGHTLTSWTKLLGGRFGPEVGWLYPIALFALFAGLLWRRRSERTDQLRAGLIMWGSWFFIYGIIFSEMSSIPHTAYVASLAPPIAALTGAGVAMLWHLCRSGKLPRIALSLVMVAQLAWVGWLWSGYPDFLPWALWTAIAVGAIAAAVLALPRLPGRRTYLVTFAVGIAAILAAPVIWGGSVLDSRYAGSSFDASAGPVSPKQGQIQRQHRTTGSGKRAPARHQIGSR